MFPDLLSSSTLWHPLIQITLFFFWLWSLFCIFKTTHYFLFVCSFPWSLPNDTRASQLPSTRIWVCPQLCLPTVLDFCSFLFSVLSCSLSLEPFPVLGNSWEKLTHNTGGLGERLLQLFLTLWTCVVQWEESAFGIVFLLVLVSSSPESHQVDNPFLEEGMKCQKVKLHTHKDTDSKTQSQDRNPCVPGP